MMLKKYVNKTGGGPSSSIIMKNVDDQIISLINPTTISGHKNVFESSVEFNFNDNIGTYLLYFNSTLLF